MVIATVNGPTNLSVISAYRLQKDLGGMSFLMLKRIEIGRRLQDNVDRIRRLQGASWLDPKSDAAQRVAIASG